MNEINTKGQCLCGKVSYTTLIPAPDIHVCHCNLCRIWSGGPVFAVSCALEDTDIRGSEYLCWYGSSQWAERGFCKACGTHVFFRSKEEEAGDYFGISAGTLDNTEDFQIAEHIFIDKKPAYYDFNDNAKRLTEEEFLAQFANHCESNDQL